MFRFLDPLASLTDAMIVNTRGGHAIASSIEVATSRRDRRRGLLGRTVLPPGCAFILAPCRAVHTVGMRFPIDVVFIDDHGTVLRLVPHLGTWRMAIAPAAAIAIELWAGAIRAMDISVGDRLQLATAIVERLDRTPSAIVDKRPATLGMRPPVPGATAARP